MGYGASGVRDVIQNDRQYDRHLGFKKIQIIFAKQIIFARAVGYDPVKYFPAFSSVIYVCSPRNDEKWLDLIIIMTS